ncbi:hypothetical protein ABZ897_33355 [Nonomuraea sp. NPDC046802]|uniref:hypothetical protein n=1 Tax=Nonomuraea sp. NPDC046802 TaxID=3154919 RepID=UPI0033E34885
MGGVQHAPDTDDLLVRGGVREWASSGLIPAIPVSTKTSLAQRLRQHVRDRWPQLAGVHVRYHGQFASIEGELADGHRLPLIRLRYGGSTSMWGFGLYLASSGKYENQILPTGMSAGTPQEALDCSCDLYLNR